MKLSSLFENVGGTRRSQTQDFGSIRNLAKNIVSTAKEHTGGDEQETMATVDSMLQKFMMHLKGAVNDEFMTHEPTPRKR